MTSREPVPPLLSPYIRVPSKGTLILCTSVLGATSNWLLLRYLQACIGSSKHGRRAVNGEDGLPAIASQDDVAVVFVSWMNDFAFWKAEAKRVSGLDLSRLQQQGRFAFVDGLTKLFDDTASSSISTPAPQARAGPHTRPGTPPPSAAPPTPQRPTPAAAGGLHYLTSPDSSALTSTINTALTTLSKDATRTILILDTPTLPISLSPSTITAQSLNATLLTLRQKTHTCIINIPVDDPFVAASKSAQSEAANGAATWAGGNTPLETETAAFISMCVSQARCVVSCRRLGTGWARDVSGVVRVTRGGEADDDVDHEEEDGTDGESDLGSAVVKEGEWLYQVDGGGGVKVWGRGSGDISH